MAKKTKETKKPRPIPSLGRTSELSTTGLKLSSGKVYEEIDEDFRWPFLVHTCKVMAKDETIYAAQNAIKSLIRRLKWKVHTPDAEGEVTDAQLGRERFINECMHDMEESWSDFINETLSSLTFGFSLHEKVYKVRKGYSANLKQKSRYNDRMYGWAKLPIRSQDTISKWNYDEYNRNITSVQQDLGTVMGISGKPNKLNTQIEIPYNKLLHFKFDSQRGNPEGNTPLKSCRVAWKYKTTIAEFEAIGVSRDMNGMPMISLPPEYMSPEASEDKKAVYEYMQEVINNLHMNEQAGLVFPRAIDPDTKQDVFDFKLVSVEGSKQFDTAKIIDRYENKILMTYLCDVLKMGQESTGSFALSDNKTNLMAVGIESILTQILEVINRDLIEQTALLNGWELNQPLPQITYDDLDERDLDTLGAFVQRCIDVGAMEVDQVLSDELRQAAKLSVADPDKKIRKELLSQSNQETPSDSSGGSLASKTSTAPKKSAAKSKGVSQ
jgi:hypothetical protein